MSRRKEKTCMIGDLVLLASAWSLCFTSGCTREQITEEKKPDRSSGTTDTAKEAAHGILSGGETVLASRTPVAIGLAASSRPTWRGDYCSIDSDCGWNNPCIPTRCGKARAGSANIRCRRASRPPGTCTCVESQCTLKPFDPGHGMSDTTAGRCKKDKDCAVDVATAVCHLKGNTAIGPIKVQGPL